jgi:hypothetical protein
MKQCFVNAEILEEAKKLRRYESNWLWHVTWMYIQQDAKNNAELQTRWMRMTWKTFEDTVRWGWNRWWMMMMMMMVCLVQWLISEKIT